MSQFLPPCLRLGNPTNQVLVTTTRRRRSVPPSGHQSCLLIIESGLLKHQQASNSQDKPRCLSLGVFRKITDQDIRLVTRVLLAIRANSHLSNQPRLTRQTLQPKFIGNSFVQNFPKTRPCSAKTGRQRPPITPRRQTQRQLQAVQVSRKSDQNWPDLSP